MTLEPMRGAHEVERIAHVFRQVPVMIVAVLLGVFLVFVFLFESVSGNALKAWVAYMLTVMAVNGWLWHAFHNAELAPESARRWEYLAALGALLSGIGWSMLAGPLYPANDHVAGDFVMMMMVAVAFSTVSFYSLSPLSFFGILIPTLLPIGVHNAAETRSVLDGPMLASVALLGVVLMLQRAQYGSLMENLRRRVESEALLAEQQAIFQSTSQGIAVIRDGRIVKGNHRLGEMLGRRLQDLYAISIDTHYVNRLDYEQIAAESQEAFRRDRTYHGVARLTRADGSEFWAELSGRRMHGEDEGRSVWLFSDMTLQHGAHHSRHPADVIH